MSLEIKTTNLGAEIISVKFNGEEKIHQGSNVLDKNGNVFWKRHAPVLFPIVGSLKDNKTIINGKEYYMSQHGFARDMNFELIEKNDNIHSYVLKSSNETLEKYPFDFELYITYVVNNDKLITKYKVINKDSKKMPFGIGGHPAFICNISNNDSYIEFDVHQEKIEFLQLENGLIKEYPVKLDILKNKKRIDLNNELFFNDAIIMKNVSGDNVYLKNKDNEILKFNFKGFPYLALWSKENAPFVCIEPWYTIADKINTDGMFENKEGTIILDPDKSFECEYEVQFK